MASSSGSKIEPKTDPPQANETEDEHRDNHDVLSVIDSLKNQVIADRYDYIKRKIEENKQKLGSVTNHVQNLSTLRKNTAVGSAAIDTDLLTKRQEDALCMLNSLELSSGEKDSSNSQEESSNATSNTAVGSNFIGKSAVRPVKLPEVQKIPPYTTWVFLDRNQRMAEDQSVLGRRRIYYDQTCGEALICSDSEEDVPEDEEEKKEFGNIEDYIARMTIKEVGMTDSVLEPLGEFLDRSPSEIKARYEDVLEREKTECPIQKQENKYDFKTDDAFMGKDLDAALDSFDNLFCRRCLVFDCRLHGCSQDLVYPAEKQNPWVNSDDAPCGIHCYKLASQSETRAVTTSQLHHTSEEPIHSSGSPSIHHSPKKKHNGSSLRRRKSLQSESASSTARAVSENSESEVQHHQDSMSGHCSSSPLKSKVSGKSGSRKSKNKRAAEQGRICSEKRQKKNVPSDSDSVASGSNKPSDIKVGPSTRHASKAARSSSTNKFTKTVNRKSRRRGSSFEENLDSAVANANKDHNAEMIKEESSDDDESSRKEFVDENTCKLGRPDVHSWKVIEKSLFEKGLEIFGRNSCLIARNLLSGMKTCMDVSEYMNYIENNGTDGADDGSNSLGDGHAKGNERTRSRFVRRRGRVRRLKYTWKSAGYHSIRKKTTERKDQPCRQYNPCGCQTACGKQCPCLINGTCCEKYCGCPKICKNRFRGCHCAKSQCRSRQCPCFAAARECDPDVCRNCWVGCGDGSLGVPNQRGDNYECRNMKLLLKQQQRVLLGKSDVSGWGAFLKNSVSKHEYLGEYTGELISHKEADKRGKIYDRENSSFLFNLNDQFVLDAYRKGDKLKFANHSPDPNCYAKVIMVGGDHRVGIFAKERIGAGEEIFYDYRYEPDRAPAWALKPESSGCKKDEAGFVPGGRAKKLA